MSANYTVEKIKGLGDGDEVVFEHLVFALISFSSRH
jgi:hypothetical protein